VARWKKRCPRQEEPAAAALLEAWGAVIFQPDEPGPGLFVCVGCVLGFGR
jgi:hypothetical protein